MLKKRVEKRTSCKMTCRAQRTRATRRMHVPRSLISRCGSRHDVDAPAQAQSLTFHKARWAASVLRDIIILPAAWAQCMAVQCANTTLRAMQILRDRWSALDRGPLYSNARYAKYRIAGLRARAEQAAAAALGGSPPEQHPWRPGMPGRKHQRPLKVLTYTCADRGTQNQC